MSSQKLKILYFTKYSRNAGSSRLRSYQYFPYLERAGFEVDVSPLFSENYLVQLYAGKSTLREAVRGYAKRFIKLFRVGNYDTIVLEKELFPYLPAFAEYLLNIFGKKYVVDYDDAIFHNYDQSSNPVIKLFLSQKIDAVMKNAAVVVAGNSYLAGRARQAGAKMIKIIPTVIDLERYPVVPFKNEKPIILGWIGTKSTFEKHVLPVMKWIQKALHKNAIEFHLVGIDSPTNYGANIKFFPWQEDTEVVLIQNFDIGIMPLQDSLWEKGKCSYKLMQYMACQKPVIASSVGMNVEVVQNKVNGYTATTENEWLSAISALVDDVKIRQIYGTAGRKMVEEQYSIQVTHPQWIEILKIKN